jgi:hypothetical protein
MLVPCVSIRSPTFGYRKWSIKHFESSHAHALGVQVLDDICIPSFGLKLKLQASSPS